ncbi:MAG TPA: hypothetical protein VG073_02095 [Gaiellaceae bacterium]|nr:hypothetical protein [Gaiellaceae bacterium]
MTGVVAALGAVCLLAAGLSAAATRDDGSGNKGGGGKLASSCRLGGGENARIKHVVYVQFDNTHLLRDRAGVPSDLEQMPHLLNFIRGNGTMLTNDHTILISHTAGGILSSLTGLYPDRHGQTVSNSYVRTSPTGSFSFPSSFGYWTDPVSGMIPNMVGPDGTNVPAPWAAYTKAGCDFGAIATANTVLENTSTLATGDITKVFGNPSPQQIEADASRAAPPNTAARTKAQTDFVGLAVHCAKGSAVCANGQDDLLPQEPGGYTGFKGLFGAQELNPVLTGGPTVNDLAGNTIADPFGQPGFPGFDGMSASTSLAYVAAMQEKGIPVTFAYISDAHDFHGVAGNAHTAFGPGSQGYVQQLKAYDDAFAAFFQRLADDGINRSNTLFVFTVDEGDHFVGGSPTPASCDGVSTPCDWTGQVGELNANIDTLFAHQYPALAPLWLGAAAPNAFTVHGDDAPPYYLAKKGAGPLGQTDPLTRAFEHAIGGTLTLPGITAHNAYTGATDTLTVRLADQTEMKALHMFTTGDPARNATFVQFADPNYFITDFPASTCETCINPAFAWNHGDIQPEIASTWLGFVGPGVQRQGSNATWTDHADVRPTMLSLLGLKDPYQSDGRVVTQILTGGNSDNGGNSNNGNSNNGGNSNNEGGNAGTLERLGNVYKQLNAPFGQFGMDTLRASTHAIKSDDATYTAISGQIADLTTQRDALAAQIRTALNDVAFSHGRLSEEEARAWIDQANELLASASTLPG